ncbi:MAG TPA: hypothetical protein VIN11_03265 [Roseivirga sp.]
MSNKKELIATSQKLKDSIENQIGDLKQKVDKYGKVSLWIGGGLLAVYLLSKVFDDGESEMEMKEEEQLQKKKKKKASKPQPSQANFLTDTLKQQAIVFALGLAAQQLRSFLQQLKDNDQEENT